jgi:putative FmdB family regulatory protein
LVGDFNSGFIEFPLSRIIILFEFIKLEVGMPSYDFSCLDCNKKFEIFLSYDQYGKIDIRCTHCSSTNIKRKIGRIRLAKSEDRRMDDLASDFSDPAALAGLEDDPKALGRMMRKMSSEMGEDMGPEFDEVIDRLEKGQSPEEIEEALPDIGSEDASDGSYGGMDDF